MLHTNDSVKKLDRYRRRPEANPSGSRRPLISRPRAGTQRGGQDALGVEAKWYASLSLPPSKAYAAPLHDSCQSKSWARARPHREAHGIVEPSRREYNNGFVPTRAWESNYRLGDDAPSFAGNKIGPAPPPEHSPKSIRMLPAPPPSQLEPRLFSPAVTGGAAFPIRRCRCESRGPFQLCRSGVRLIFSFRLNRHRQFRDIQFRQLLRAVPMGQTHHVFLSPLF